MLASNEAGAASAAATTTALGTVGTALAVLAPIAAALGLAFEGVKQQAEAIDPSAQQLISTLGLTRKEVEKLKDTTVSWGDIAVATFDVVAGAAGTSGSEISSAFHSAFSQVADFARFSASVVLGAFAAAVKGVHDLLGSLPQIGLGVVTGNFGLVGGAVKDAGKSALDQFYKTFGDVQGGFDKIAAGASSRRDTRVRDQANKIIADRTPRQGGSAGGREATDHADDQIAQLNEQILSAKEKLAGTVEEQAALAIQQVSVERDKTIADAASKLAQGKITGAENQQIDLLANQLADLKKQAILRDEQTKLLTQQQAAQDQVYGFQADALKNADQLATSQAEHRKLQLEIIDIEYQQKKYDLQILLAKQKIAGDLAGQALTQGKLDNLPTAQAQAQALVRNNTLSPLEQWVKSVPHDAAAITEALQSIETRGLDSLASSITDLISGTKSLGEAFKDVAQSIISDIIQMTVRMLIFRAVSSIFGSIGGIGGGGASPVGVSTASSFISPSNDIGSWLAGARASGGPVSAGQTYLVGEKGPELFRPSQSGTIIPNAANNNQSGPVQVELSIGFGAAPEFAPYVDQVATTRATQAVQVSIKHTDDTIRRIARPKMNGSN
jgi:lambda family phage tail tape measure protein